MKLWKKIFDFFFDFFFRFFFFFFFFLWWVAGQHKWDYFYELRLFLMVKVQNWNMGGGCLLSNIFGGMPDLFSNTLTQSCQYPCVRGKE